MDNAVMLINALKWPIVVVIIGLIIFFTLKKQIGEFVAKLKNIKYGSLNASAEPSQQVQQSDTALLSARDEFPKADRSNGEKVIGLLLDDTLQLLNKAVQIDAGLDQSNGKEHEYNKLYTYSLALYITLIFERWYYNSFGSQLYLLESLNTVKQTKQELKRYYDTAAIEYPDFYKTYTYDEYFGFLLRLELVVLIENDSYIITHTGRDFLKWIVANGKTMAKSF